MQLEDSRINLLKEFDDLAAEFRKKLAATARTGHVPTRRSVTEFLSTEHNGNNDTWNI
jgi:hypothetical protein